MTMESMQETVDKLQPLKQKLLGLLGEPEEKKRIPMSWVVFDKNPSPCTPHNNGDHSDCEEECKHDEGAYA